MDGVVEVHKELDPWARWAIRDCTKFRAICQMAQSEKGDILLLQELRLPLTNVLWGRVSPFPFLCFRNVNLTSIIYVPYSVITPSLVGQGHQMKNKSMSKNKRQYSVWKPVSELVWTSNIDNLGQTGVSGPFGCAVPRGATPEHHPNTDLFLKKCRWLWSVSDHTERIGTPDPQMQLDVCVILGETTGDYRWRVKVSPEGSFWPNPFISNAR